jgi:hypothetical protein
MGDSPRIPVSLAWEQSVVCVVPICTANRKPVLANPETFRAFKFAGNFSAALKRSMRGQLGASWQWQIGRFDRLLRTNESLHDKCLYIRENPVRAGLVQKWEDWPCCYEFNEEIGKRRACPRTLHEFDSVSGMRFPQ